MKTLGRRAILAAALAALVLFPATARSRVKAGGYALEVKISPMADAARQYTCEATVKDLASGEVVAAPRLQVLAGKSNVASTSDKTGKHDVTFSVSIEGEGKEARYTLEVSEGETVIASQKAAVKLR
jgi:hypothetical protein